MYKENFKVKLDHDNSVSLNTLFRLFIVHGEYELYLVGGCVRDFLLGRKPNDIDLCTNATPEQVKELLHKQSGYKTWDSGLKHGTLTVTDSLYHTSYEITTFRIDGDYLDNRHPENVQFTSSLEEDLKRRDFTINSMAYNLLTEELIMLDESFKLDLQFKVIKCVGSPNERFQEDALRMLRAVRFSAQLGATIEQKTFEAINKNAALIENISRERVRDELTKILCSDNPQRLELLELTGITSHDVLPFMLSMLQCKQHNKYHYTDVLHHTFDVIKALPKDDMQLRWAAFLHDTGKPDCVTVDEAGFEHFYGHAELSAYKALTCMDELKFDNDTKDIIYKIIKFHDAELGGIKMSTFKKLIINVGEDLFSRYLSFRQADASAHNLSEESIKNISVAKERYKKIILEGQTMTLKKLAINGNDLIDLGHLGKEVGVLLNKCLELVLENPESNTRETLIDYVKRECYNKEKEIYYDSGNV